MARRLWARGSLGLLLSASCVTSSAVEEDLSRLRRNVTALEKTVMDLKGTVDRMDGQLTLLALNRRGDVTTSAAPQAKASADTQGPSSRPATSASLGSSVVTRPGHGASRPVGPPPALPVVRLGRASDTERATSEEDAYPAESLDDGRPPILIKLGPSDVGDRIPFDREVLEKPDPVLGGGRNETTSRSDDAPPPRGVRGRIDRQASGSVAPRGPSSVAGTEGPGKAEYDAALKLLRDDDRPKGALSAFLAFKEKYPKSELADNVAYWLGECHYALAAYEDAIREFDVVVRDHPRSAKVPYALVSKAESWLKLGRAAKARRVLSRVVETYPGTDAASKARARLASLGAGTR